MAVNIYTCTVTELEAAALKNLLESRNWEFTSLQYARYKAIGNNVNVVAYESGKLVVQGKGTEEFVLYTLEPEILHTFTFTGEKENTVNPAELTMHGGIDESGKGDFFGPLIIAGVVVTPETAPKLRELGVCDSKKITSSEKIIKLAAGIRSIAAGSFSMVTLLPETYNRLYSSIGNLNRMLAWGHARVIENLLELQPSCPRMLSDKFGNESLIRNALMERGRLIKMEQMVRAESDVAVAAASILARDGFLAGMKKISETAGCILPKGAGAGVKSTAAELFKTQGAEVFRKIAKLHFKTWEEISNQ
ncbi:MAG: ribonuclease HIII [Lentisphaerae bacterium]|nr:ribonuclease HIII [Lentisphaerota bacterium]